MNSSLELSAVVLDVDRTLIRSVHNDTPNNPYPYYKSQHVEEYFHFTLNREPKRSHSVSAVSHHTHSHTHTHTHSSESTHSKTPKHPKSKSPFAPKTHKSEHYHIYIRPGLKKLFTYLSYLQQNTNVKIVIASMAKRDYINSILKGLKKHCSERKFPTFDCVLTRESWDQNLSPSSTPTYPIKVLLEQYKKHGFTKPFNLRFKSIAKIAHECGIGDRDKHKQNILVVDDDMGYYDHEDRVSGQIYQIPAWNGPVNYRRNRNNRLDLTLYPTQSDNELPSLGAMIQAIVDNGSIQKYLFTRVLSVFKHEYGTKYKKQMKLRKDMMNILMKDIGMDIDEDTAISSLWIFDNILRCCKDSELDSDGLGECIEILFGCIIVYQMYIYDVHPSAHFYRLSFTQNEFWKQVMDVFFEYYVRLLFHIKDARIQPKRPKPQSKTQSPTVPARASQFMNKFIHNTTVNNITNTHTHTRRQRTESNVSVSDTKRQSIINTQRKERASLLSNVSAPIEVAQSEPTEVSNVCIEAQEEVIMSEDDKIILTAETYKSIQDNLKLLVKSISQSIFCKNLSPVCFIGSNLLAASRTNPVPKCISKYQRILKKVYRDRQ